MLEHLQWLSGTAGTSLLTEMMQRAKSGDSVTQLAKAIRKKVDLEHARTLLDQIELRQRAAQKFTLAHRMWFTRIGYEQSTSEEIARYKAGRFQEGIRVVDLCCGIGGDLIGLSERADIVGVDRDPICCWMAKRNVQAYRNAETEVIEADADAHQVSRCDAWHIDPDRRAHSKRTTQVDFFSPSRSALDELLERQPNAAIKLAPATDCPDDWLANCEREWIGDNRECKQQVAWFGNLMKHPARRIATVVHQGNSESLIEDPEADLDHAAWEVGPFLCECHPSILAGDLLATAGKRFDMSPLAPGHALFTSNDSVDSGLIRCFRVLATTRLNKRSIETQLSENAIGSLEIKCHGLQDDQWKKWRPRCEGTEHATLVLTRLASQHLAILVKRLP